MSRSFQAKTLLFFVAIVASAGLGRAAEIRLRAEAETTSAIIRLGDVADIVGDPRDVAKLRQLELAVAPTRNGVRELTNRQIRERLVLRGMNPVQHRLVGASKVVVQNKIALKRPFQTNLATVSSSSQSVTPTPRKAKDADHPLIVVAARTMRAGERIGRGDVKLARSRSKTAPYGAYLDLENLYGMEVKNGVSSGRPVSDRDVQLPILVHRNDEARLIVRSGAVQIAVGVKVLSNGALNDFVPVERLGSKEKFSARVVGERQVELTTNSVSASPNSPPKLSIRDRYTQARGLRVLNARRQAPSRVPTRNISYERNRR